MTPLKRYRTQHRPNFTSECMQVNVTEVVMESLSHIISELEAMLVIVTVNARILL